MRPFKLLVSLALALAPVMVEAQQGATISGRVIGEGGAPVRGAQVFLEGMGLGAQTNDDGVYSFGVPAARANGQTVRLTARFIGLTAGSATIVLTPGSTTRNFTLAANPLRLDEVVITGAGTSTQANKLGNVRNNVDSMVLVKSNETNLVNALAGKAPNVEVSSQSGEAGASSYPHPRLQDYQRNRSAALRRRWHSDRQLDDCHRSRDGIDRRFQPRV